MNRSASTQRHWRSLNDLENTPEFQDLLQKEFPGGPEEDWSSSSRRRFLQVMGASLALGTAASCRFQEEHILPLKARDEDRVPGRPKHYAGAIEFAGFAQPLLVACYDGRPTKVDGNPEHPESLGASNVWAQAAILGLYDPDRSRGVARTQGGAEVESDWAAFEAFVQEHFRELKSGQGQGLAVISGATRSPSLRRAIADFRKFFPRATWTEWEAAGSDAEASGCRAAFGQPVRPRLRLAEARVIVALDDDPLYARGDSVRLQREFAARRKPEAGWMNRLWAFEPVFTVTGAAADHRLPVRRAQIGALLARLEALLVEKGLAHPQAEAVRNGAPRLELPGLDPLLAALAEDLMAQRGAAVLTAGPWQPAEVHARVHRLNALLGAPGRTVDYLPEAEPDAGLLPPAALARDLGEGKVRTLLVLGGNPVYDAPADLGFAAAMAKAQTRIHFGLHRDETAALCDWHAPMAHALESWTDGVAGDGSHVIGQPMIEPIWGGRSAAEFLTLLMGNAQGGLGLVARGVAGGEAGWRKAVHDGFVAGSAAQPVAVQPGNLPAAAFDEATLAAAPANGALEINFAPCPKLWDGRYANSGWLQELPDPITKITWSNAAFLSYATAERLGVRNEEMIRVEAGGRALEIVACTVPGAADGQLTIWLGYGRTRAGHVAGLADDEVESAGFDANRLRGSEAPWTMAGGRVGALGTQLRIATTQDHHMIDEVGLKGRADRVEELVREGTLARYEQDRDFAKRGADFWGKDKSLFAEVALDGEYRWGMAIDLSSCTGCGACTIACQAENNVPVVGREQVLKGREMHWIRMDRYFQGDVANPRAVHQPVNCQQCELAPCESVCPVAATVHTEEGLNDMVYNRCVGTRYCSNNCPYKVRRFNFFNHRKDAWQPGNEVLRMASNPEVTVRSRGVMEKCTFCVQRIQAARVQSKLDGRRIGGDEVRTACQQVCPSQAIVFGDLKTADSAVAQAHGNHRAYAMLAELNNKPRNRFLARIRNPHPLLALPLAGAEEGHHG